MRLSSFQPFLHFLWKMPLTFILKIFKVLAWLVIHIPMCKPWHLPQVYQCPFDTEKTDDSKVEALRRHCSWTCSTLHWKIKLNFLCLHQLLYFLFIVNMCITQCNKLLISLYTMPILLFSFYSDSSIFIAINDYILLCKIVSYST